MYSLCITVFHGSSDKTNQILLHKPGDFCWRVSRLMILLVKLTEHSYVTVMMVLFGIVKQALGEQTCRVVVSIVVLC